ncbi:hypothetical protein [Chamaesiphon sp. VAR_48_metabat_403]|uniref:hypothetical protein n=1 Tax=Chamaesiphon sp. VAR_48_metabat_403 TaxID=2964700 RepID=UPI00286E4510|nr:hypothetical protein [Chamaesiphon sp. VAR_48_metabat_403]
MSYRADKILGAILSSAAISTSAEDTWIEKLAISGAICGSIGLIVTGGCVLKLGSLKKFDRAISN